MSAAVSVNLMLYGLTAPFAAALTKRFGLRPVVSAGLLLIAAGSGLSVLARAAWQLVLTWGVLTSSSPARPKRLYSFVKSHCLASPSTTVIKGEGTSDQGHLGFELGVGYRLRPRALLEVRFAGRRGLWRALDTYVKLVVWNEQAEAVADSLRKGMRVIVQGRWTQRTYESRSGEKHTALEVRVDEIGPSLRWASAEVKKRERTTVSATTEPEEEAPPF